MKKLDRLDLSKFEKIKYLDTLLTNMGDYSSDPYPWIKNLSMKLDYFSQPIGNAVK